MLTDAFKREVLAMGKEDLNEAWAFLQLRYKAIDHEALYTFNVGDEVTFKHKKITHKGIVKKINNSKLKVEVIDPFGKPITWTCPPSVLTKVK